MFDLTPENSKRFDEIYERCKDNPMPDTDDVLDLVGMFTLRPPRPWVANTYVADLCVDVLKNICTGRWTMLPYMWASQALTDIELEYDPMDEKRACEKISNETIHMSRELQLSVLTPIDLRRLALHWIRTDSYGFNHTGFQNMLYAAKAFFDIYNFLRKKENST